MSVPIILNLTASPTEQSIDLICYGIKFLKNDGSNNLYIGLGKSTSKEGYILLKPNEYIEDWKINPVGKIFYKSENDNVPFRFYSESV